MLLSVFALSLICYYFPYVGGYTFFQGPRKTHYADGEEAPPPGPPPRWRHKDSLSAQQLQTDPSSGGQQVESPTLDESGVAVHLSHAHIA